MARRECGFVSAALFAIGALLPAAAGAWTAGPLALSGGLHLDMSGYTVSGTPARERPFSWSIYGEPTVSAFGIALPFSFIVSEQERAFRQPFNQFGVSPSWRWATAHIGYRNITWSPYTLAGRTFLGGGVEISPGLLRVGAMYGRFQRAVREDTTAVDVEQTPAYRRTGYAFKLGLGRPSNYVDLIFLKAADDSLSLPARPLTVGLMPAENAVLGLSTRQQFGKLLLFSLDLGASVLTRDQASQAISFDNPLLKSLSRIIQPRFSTKYYFAGRTGLTLTLGGFATALQYERVEPEYLSMGANPVTTDQTSISLAPTLRLFSDRLILSGSVGSQQDNLLRTKLATTRRLTWSTGAGIYPTANLGVDVRYANFGTSQSAGTVPVADSTRLDQVNRTLSLTPHLSFTTGSTAHSLALAVNYTGLTDAGYGAAGTSSSTVAAFSYGLGTAGFSASAAATWAATGAGSTRGTVAGLSLTGAKPLLDRRLNVSVAPSIAWTTAGGVPAATTLTARADANFQPQPSHTFRAGLALTSSRARIAGSASFTEFSATAGYAFSF